jgi:ribosomal protein S18 acetylase RimI-like enzyme
MQPPFRVRLEVAPGIEANLYNMQIEILRASQNDLETILQLQKDCYNSEAEIYNNYSIQPLQQDLKSLENEFKNTTILKGTIHGEIVGSVRGFAENGTSYIGKLIVKKDFQNKGIGRMLLDSIESIFKGCNRFELFTGFKSEKNLYLYNKQGYTEFKRQMIDDRLTMVYLEKINQITISQH